jgi:hypothetical protein
MSSSFETERVPTMTGRWTLRACGTMFLAGLSVSWDSYCGDRLTGGDAKYAFDSASLLFGVTLSGSIRTMRYTM